MKLRDYQLELIDGVYDSMKQGNKKIMVTSPAGSGKSVTMSEIARRATKKGNRVLFVVHRVELVTQIKQTFISNNVDMDLCHVGMIQTVTNQVKRGVVPVPSIILVDEAHHSAARTYRNIFDAFPDSYVLGFTATPTLLSGKGLNSVFDDLILGKTVQWLIDNNRLAPFKYYSVNLVNDEKLKHTSTGDFSHSSMSEAVEKAIHGDVVDHYRKLADGKKTIIYTHNVESSRQVATEFREHGYAAIQVDGGTHKKDRIEAMESFRSGEVQILVNAELYGEGVDVPDCQCVILLRPTESLTLFIQQTMRSMRYMPNKQAIIIDHVGNYTRHGLPNAEHDWKSKFEGTVKDTKSGIDDGIPLKECVTCYSVIQSNVEKCPYCGHEFLAEEVELKQVDAELVEIDQSFKVDYRLLEYADKDLKDLKTLDDYYLYAIATKKSLKWIKFMYGPLKNKSWPGFYQALKPIKQKYNY